LTAYYKSAILAYVLQCIWSTCVYRLLLFHLMKMLL